MRYFIDTEFIDDGITIDLISIGIVCEDGRELYLQSCEFEPGDASSWVKENVLTHLLPCPQVDISSDPYAHTALSAHDGCPWRTRKQMMYEVRQFFNPSDGFELWGWCAGYDFVALCQLFGAMMDLPQGYPHYIKDIQYILDEHDIADEELPAQGDGLHNALADARHIKRLWEWLHEFGRSIRT